MKLKTISLSLTISNNGEYFGMYCKDKHYRIFQFTTGKLLREFNESLKHYVENYNEILKNDLLKIDKQYFDKRLGVEKEIERDIDVLPPNNIQFDETNTYIMFPSLLGIKLFDLQKGNLIKVIGKNENERFLTINLFQGKALRNNSGLIGTGGQSSQGDKVVDPIIFTIAYRRNRFYMFTKREPADIDKSTKRDILNEKPTEKEIQMYAQINSNQLASQVLIETSLGEIHVKLFPKECPRTVENFVTHSKNGYYDNLLFHRVIKGFMIQTGDPLGNGTGGESVWGGEFEDEFNNMLRHDKPFVLSMANHGPNTNGSQFFITTVPCPWLDNKHTVFGKVFKGTDTVLAIENIKCDRNDKPLIDARLYTIKIIE